MIYIGYLHWKTNAKTAEIDIAFETNPYQLRTIVNSEMILNLNLKLQKFLNKIDEEKLNEEDKKELKKLQDEFNEFVATRKFRNYDDWKYFNKIDKF